MFPTSGRVRIRSGRVERWAHSACTGFRLRSLSVASSDRNSRRLALVTVTVYALVVVPSWAVTVNVISVAAPSVKIDRVHRALDDAGAGP